MYERFAHNQIVSRLKPGRVSIVYGPRRSGKTTILRQIQASYSISDKCLWTRGDDPGQSGVFIANTSNSGAILSWLGGIDILIIDEAQAISGIGSILKNIVDTMPGLIVLASGSSSFELARQVGEPLVGRKTTHMLYPLAFGEVNAKILSGEELANFLVYGGYPLVVTASIYVDKAYELEELLSGYLFKDVFAYEGIKNSKKIHDLLELIAYDIGSELSVNKYAEKLDISRHKIEQYLDLFEKTFIIFSIGGLSRNLRKEVYRHRKYYFYDQGVRNALIRNLNPIGSRNDHGQLWENFCMSERRKYNSSRLYRTNDFYWRTYDQQEIDLVEEEGGKLNAYEFKWGSQHVKAPAIFTESYPNSSFSVVNNTNYLDNQFIELNIGTPPK